MPGRRKEDDGKPPYRLCMLIPQSREGRDKVEPRSSWRRCLRCSTLDRCPSQRSSSLKGNRKQREKHQGLVVEEENKRRSGSSPELQRISTAD